MITLDKPQVEVILQALRSQATLWRHAQCRLRNDVEKHPIADRAYAIAELTKQIDEADRLAVDIAAANVVVLMPAPALDMVAKVAEASDWRGRLLTVAESLVSELRRQDMEGCTVQELILHLSEIANEED